jgi:nucleotide-binding universal stress UspA family protein
MKKIVVGIDGSEASKNALRWAVDEARLRDAQVVALHAWETPIASPDATPAQSLDVVTAVTESHEAASQLVTEIVEEVVGDDPNQTVTPLAVEGAAAATLLDAARDAGLLVVGSRGLGDFGALLLGSVSQECAQHAPCPVLIHRSGERVRK